MPVILQVQQQPIYGAIAQRFLQMVSFNLWVSFHIGNSASHFQQALPCTDREPKSRQCLFKPAGILSLKMAKLPNLSIIQTRIQLMLTSVLSGL